MAVVTVAVIAVVPKAPAKDCLGVVRAFCHCQPQRLKQLPGVFADVPALFRKVRRAFVVRRPTDIHVTAAIVAAGVDGVVDTFQRRFDAVQVRPASCLVPLDCHCAILCSNQSIGCAQVGGFLFGVRGVAFKLKAERPAAPRCLALGLCGKGVKLKVRGVVPVGAAANAAFMDIGDGFGGRPRLNGVGAVTGLPENRDGLTTQLAFDTGAGFCGL